MICSTDISNLEKMGITFKLSANGKYANVYKKDKFVGSVYNTKNTIYFCGKTFLETNGIELIDFLNKNTSDVTSDIPLTNDEIFCIWKRCILENRLAHSFDSEFGKNKGYIYNCFKRLKLAKSYKERFLMDKESLDNIMKQKYYDDAKKILINY